MFINIYAACMECEKIKYGDHFPDGVVPETKHRRVEIQDDLTLRFECEKNHKAIIQLEQEKFEVLFEFATMALIDGYTKEAVSTYSSALERFIEFYILTIFMVKKKTKHDFDRLWKTMVKQSERQLGTYLTLVTLEGHTNLWDSERSGFRNLVIHQGLIPTYNKAIDYGNYVLKFIRNGLEELRKTDQYALKTAVWVNRKSLLMSIYQEYKQAH
ncbi:MAG: hypothetical protein QM737_12715 [Ferruginibacter sp.]